MSIRNVTLEPIFCFSQAEKSIASMEFYLEFRIDNMIDYNMAHTCFEARNAAKYILMGYLFYNDIKLRNTYYLESLCKKAIKIDKTFLKVQADCELLKNYTGKLNYVKWDVSNHELHNAIKSLLNIYNLTPINNLRKLLSKNVKFKENLNNNSINYLSNYIYENKGLLSKDDRLLSLNNKKNSIVYKKGSSTKIIGSNKIFNIRSKINIIKQLIVSSVHKDIIIKIYIFGSYAYGNPTESSDIDICIIIGNEYEWSEVATDIRVILWKNIKEDVNLIVKTEETFYNDINHNSLSNIIIKHGLLLYSVKENPTDLILHAKYNIDNILNLIKSIIYSDNWKNEGICYHTSQFIINILKGYLIHKGISIEPKRNLDLLWESTIKLNLLKNSKKSDFNKLKRYSGDVKSRIKTSSNDVKIIMKLLIYIYNSLKTKVTDLCNLENEVYQLNNFLDKGEYSYGNYN